MRRIFRLILLTGALLLVTPTPVSAANQVNSIDIEAVIQKDGSMDVTQTWEGIFEEGTENYFPMNGPDYLTIYDLQVSDQNGNYEFLNEWDIDADFEEKANKCGIHVTDSGYEICFGISEYGNNQYVINYRLMDVIGSYTDYDGVNFRFVNDQMNTTPTDVTIEIRLADGTAITDEIADIWGFGYGGQVEFSDGAIRAYTETPIMKENHVTLMFCFSKGILSPERVEAESFEVIKERALEDSDYTYDESYEETELSPVEDAIYTAIGAVILLMVFVSPILLIVYFIRNGKKGRKRRLQAFAKECGYHRELPNEGNMNATYSLGRLFEICDDGAIIGTSILRLLDLGCLTPVMTEETGFMGKSKEIVSLMLTGSNHLVMNEFDEYLYTVLEGAAGSDGTLQPKELGKFAGKKPELLRNFMDKCDCTGREYLSEKNSMNRWDIPSKLKYLTESGRNELGELLGFKKYLEDFSLISERNINEVIIWKELLSYAMLFGIGDTVAKQLNDIYPNISNAVELYNQSMLTAYSYYRLMHHNMREAEIREEQKRSSGSGGFSSFGGGGGSIGGGSGGGSR